MEEVDAVVQGTTLSLRGPVWLVVLALVVFQALRSSRPGWRVLGVGLLVLTACQREWMNGSAIRILVENRNLHGGASPDFVAGAGVMHLYASGNQLYMYGTVGLLAVLALLPRRSLGKANLLSGTQDSG